MALAFLHQQFFFHICLQFFYNNRTTCHKELQVFPEVMDNHCGTRVIYQDILDELPEYILLDYFYRLNLHQYYQRFLTT